MMKSFFYSIVGLLFFLCGCQEERRKSGPVDYATMEVALSERTLNRSYPAVVRGKENVEIRPQVSGCITEICIEEGAKVKRGESLFIIDQAPYQAALQTAEANVKSAEAKLETARLTYDSKKRLFEEEVVSEFDLITTRNALSDAEALLAQAKAAETNARNNLSYTVVKSPVDGITSMIPYRVGALVSSSIDKPLVTVSDDREVYAYFSMSENQVLDMMQNGEGSPLGEHTSTQVEFELSNGSAYLHKGRIDAISGTVETSTGSIQLRAVYPNQEHILRNGSTGKIILPIIYKDCIAIPQGATYELQNKIFVYKVIEGKAVSAPIEVLSQSDGKEYIVTSGLSVGDRIISQGAGLVVEGTEVKL